MCRLMGFIGTSPMLLADVVLWPDRSIIKQSYDAKERKGDPNLPFHLAHGSLNGDGFGIGWFSADERREKDPTPCVFTSITPAWNNENLARLACKIVSPLIFAHVRAAYPGMPVSEQNCHPFMYGRYMWMHNGVVAGFSQIKRALLALLSDGAYNSIQSFHSDSAVSFALFLHHLPDLFAPQPPEVLLKAVQDTILTIGQLQRAAGITATSLLNFCVSDGSCMISTRFVSPETADAASLYYAEGKAFVRSQEPVNGKGEGNGGPCCAGAGTSASSSILHESSYDLVYGERGSQVAFVVSEPITGSSADWVAVPKNMALIVTREKGGFINIMRASLLAHAPGPAMELGAPQQQLLQHSSVSLSDRGLRLSQGGADLSAFGRLGSGGTHGLSSPFFGLSSQLEVAVCLEAISRGLAAKSRPWLSATAQTLRQQLSTQAESMTERVSQEGGVLGMRVTSNNIPSGQISRYDSLSAPEPRLTTQGSGPDLTVSVTGAVQPMVTQDPSPSGHTALPDLLTLHRDEETPHFQRLVGHTGPVLCMAIHDEAGRLYTASSDCTIKTWSLADNRCLGSVTAGKKPITCMFLRGPWLFSGAGRKLRVWDTTRDMLCVDTVRIANLCGNIRCLLAVPGKVFLGCQDASVKAFLVDESHWKGVSESRESPRHSPGRRTSFDATPAREADLSTPSQGGHVGAVNALALNNTGDLILSAAGDAMIRVWRTDTLQHVRTLRGHRGSVLSLLVIENLLVSGARDNTIRVWDLDLDMMCRCTLTGHKDDVTHLSTVTLKRPLPGGTQPATAKSSSGSIAAAAAASTVSQQTQTSQSQLLLPCTVVASASADGTVRLWSLTWTCLAVLALPSAPRHALANPGTGHTPFRTHQRPSLAGTDPAVTQRLNSLRRTPVNAALEPGSPKPLQPWGAQVPAVLCVAMTGSTVCAGYSDGELRLWPCAGVHLLALRLVASDLGLLPASVTEPTPNVLSPQHPLMGPAARWACISPATTPHDHTPPVTPPAAIAKPMEVPQTLGQANLKDVLSVLSHAQVAGAATGALLSSTVTTVPTTLPATIGSHQSAPKAGVPMPIDTHDSVVGVSGSVTGASPESAYGSATTHVTRSSGSHLLDSHMRRSLGGMMLAGSALGGSGTPGLANSPTWLDTSLHSPGLVSSPASTMTSIPATDDGAAHARTANRHSGGLAAVAEVSASQEHLSGLLQGADGNGPTVVNSFVPPVRQPVSSGSAASPSLLTQQLASARTSSGGALTDPAQPTVPTARHSTDGSTLDDNTTLAQHANGHAQDGNGVSHGLASEAAESQAYEAFGSLMRTELFEKGGQRTTAGSHLESCDEEDLRTLDTEGAGTLDRAGNTLDLAIHGEHEDAYQRRLSGESITCGGAVGGAAGPNATQLLSHRVSMHSVMTGDDWGATEQLTGAGALLQQLLNGTPGGQNGTEQSAPELVVPPHLQNLLSAALEGKISRTQTFLAPGLSNTSSTDVMMESCLRDFVRIPTVSSNPKNREDCVRGAKFLAKLLESLGADVKVVRPYDDKNPVVLARLGHDPSKATVCFYGHYDVQPATEPEWATNPFELAAVNEYLYGRGTSDNKGPILAFIFAVKELMDQVEDEEGPGASRSLPVNIVFIFEGEEENGSIGFREAVTQNLRWFEGTQLVVISNTNWVGESVPCITYGMRGMMSVSVSVSGPQRDVHSGNDGGVFVEPMMDLINTMSTVMQPGTSQIKIPGFNDQVAPGLMDLAWSSLQLHGPSEFSREGYQAALGVPALTPPPGTRNLLEARWCRPSLSVVDMRPHAAQTALTTEKTSCYRFGPTRFSVIPATAVAKISVRFVARQCPKHIIQSLRAHIHREFEKLQSPNTMHVHVDALGNWWEADLSSKWIQMAEAAVRKEWGCDPLYVREGGTMPVASVLERLLSAPAIMIPMGQSSDSPHLANERIRRQNLIKGKGVIRALLEEVAGFWQPGAPSRDLAEAQRRQSEANTAWAAGNGAAGGGSVSVEECEDVEEGGRVPMATEAPACGGKE